MKRWTVLAAVAAFGLGVGAADAQSAKYTVTSVGAVQKANPRGSAPVKWSEAAKNDQVRLMVGEVKQWAYHSHGNETHIVVVVKGRGMAMVDGKHYDIKPGDVLTLPSGVRHSIEQAGKEPLVIVATWSLGFDPSRDTMKHEMDHAGHGMHQGHAVKPASATTTGK